MIAERKIDQAISKARSILRSHSLDKWSVEINTSYENVADVVFGKNTVRLNERFVLQANESEFDGVMLHEVAHALLGPDAGHGSMFVELCEKISPTPLYACEKVNIPIGKYKVECPSCAWGGTTDTTPEQLEASKKYYCVGCGKKGVRLKVTIKENKVGVKEW